MYQSQRPWRNNILKIMFYIKFNDVNDVNDCCLFGIFVAAIKYICKIINCTVKVHFSKNNAFLQCSRCIITEFVCFLDVHFLLNVIIYRYLYHSSAQKKIEVSSNKACRCMVLPSPEFVLYPVEFSSQINFCGSMDME